MKYRYTAKDTMGKTVRGILEAGSKQMAAEILREQKLTAVGFSPVHEGWSFNSGSLFGQVSASDLANFTRQLSTMVTAGLPLTDGLNLLRIQSPPALIPVVAAILTDVQSGLSLSAAMAKHPRVFSRVYVSLVKAGEAAGVMEDILNRLADTSEKSREFRAKVSGAMIYPVIIVIGMIGVTILMMVVVIPKLTSLYQDFGAELPLATRMLIGMSNFTVNYWWLLIGGLVASVFGIRHYLASQVGRSQWDTVIYKLPVVGPLARQVMLTELTRTLSLLVGAGVSIVEALNIVASASGNVVVERELNKFAKKVEKGFPVSISFLEAEIFPAMIGQMIAVGEETGKLDDVLAKLSHFFEVESEEKVKGLTTAIEPIILVILAIGVGFLMYAIVLPIYSITNQF